MLVMKTLAAGVIALGALAASAPADARSFRIDAGASILIHDQKSGRGDRWDRDDRDRHRQTLSAKELQRILRSRGYRDISYLDRRGKIYQVYARDYRGRRVGLIVSARTGAILTAWRRS